MLLSLSLSCACFVFVKISLYLNTLWVWHACFVPGWTDRQHMQCCLRNQPLAPVVSHFSSASANRSCQLGGQLARLYPSFFTNPRRDFAAIPGRPWILLFVNCLMSAFGKRFRNSARAFSWKRRTFFWPVALTATLSMCICIMVVLTIVARLLITRIEEKPTYIRLLSSFIYNSWYNLKVPEGRLYWLILIPTIDQNLQNCQETITLLMFWKNNLTPCLKNVSSTVNAERKQSVGVLVIYNLKEEDVRIDSDLQKLQYTHLRVCW